MMRSTDHMSVGTNIATMIRLGYGGGARGKQCTVFNYFPQNYRQTKGHCHGTVAENDYILYGVKFIVSELKSRNSFLFKDSIFLY